MELKLQNSQIVSTNTTKILSIHSVDFTNSLSGLYLLSAGNQLSHYQVNQNLKEISKKWDFQFQGNPVQILYVGKSHQLVNPHEKLLVTKEPIGVVFYRANASGLEELDTDIRFNHVAGTSNQDKIFMGNFFENSYYNPGLLYRRASTREVKVYLVDYLNWADSEALPLSAGELQLPPEFSSSQNIWVEHGWANQDFILTCDNFTLNIYKFDYYHRVEKIGHATLPSTLRASVTSAQFFEENSKQKMITYFETLAIVYIYQANRQFAAEDYFYIDGDLPLTKHPLISKRTPSIWMDGPRLLPVTSNESNIFSHESYWTQPFVKSLAVFEKSSTLIYEQNQSLKIGMFSFEETLSSPQNFEQIRWKPSFLEQENRNSTVKEDETDNLANKSSYDKSLLENIRLQQFMEESVQLQSGQLQLVLPLIPFINFGLQYSFSSGLSSHLLGKHWELLGYSYISLDPGQIHFQSDKRYYMVLGKEVYALEKTQGSNTIFKQLSSKNSSTKISSILFDTVKNEWTVTTDISKMSFGGSSGTVKEGVQTRNWVSENSLPQVKIALEWHLTRYENLLTGKILQYEYTVQEKVTEGVKHANKIILKKVTVGENASISFDVSSGTDYQLRGYELQSSEYRQFVKFGLKTIQGNQFLASISQQFGTRWEKLIEFDYDYNTKLLNKITIPTWKSIVKYNYINPTAPARPGYQFGISMSGEVEDIQKKIAAVHGNGFSVFAYGSTVLIYKITDGSTVKFPLSQQLSTDHKLAMEGRCIFLLNRSILTYCYSPVNVENPNLGFQWKEMQVLNIAVPFKDILMTHTGTVLVKTGARELNLFQWDDSKSLWNKFLYSTSRDIKTFKMDDIFRIFAWIDDEYTIYWVVGSKDRKSETLLWTPVKSLHLPSRTGCGEFFASKFDLGSKYEEDIKNYFQSFQFQLRHNVIALQFCSLNDWTVNTVTDLVILDDSMNTIHKSFTVPQENIQILRREDKVKDQKFIYTYEKSAGRFLIKREAEGHPEYTGEITASFRKQMSAQRERLFMLNLSLYQMILQSGSLVFLSNNKNIYHDSKSGWTQGNRNNEEQKSSAIKLQEHEDNLKLQQKTPQETIKISSATDKILHDFGTKNGTNLGNFYPHYMGATNEVSKELSVIEFSGNSQIKRKIYPSEEIFVGLSGPTLLATRKTMSPDQLIVRTTVWDPQMVVGRLDIKSGDFVDKTVHYELTNPHLLLNGNLMFYTAQVIPGKLSKLYGWIEHRTLSNQGNATEITSKVYDGFGNFLHDLTQEKPREETPIDDIFVLKDKNKKFDIANFYPFELSSCQSAYIGFEDYETFQTSPNCSKWTFPLANIHKNKFSFTGKNFLRLNSPKEQIRLELPWEQGLDYTITAWVRAPSVKFKNVKNTLILAASLMTPKPINWMSKVIFSSGPWTLLRLEILDLQIDPYRQTFHNSRVPIMQKNTKIQLAISGQLDSIVDVDHIIVSPTAWDAEVVVRDPITLQKTETILGRSGFISRDRFDSIGRPFVHINPRGEVHQLQLDSLRTNTQGLRSSALFKTTKESGWYEYCHPSMDQSLTLEIPANWSVSPGKLIHKRNIADQLEFLSGSYSSLVFRFWYTMKGNFAQMQFQFFGTSIKTIRKFGKMFLNVGRTCTEVEIGEENSITLAILDRLRFAVWIDRDLVCESYLKNPSSENSIKMKISGGVTISDIVFIPDPSLEITYFTLEDQEIQRIQLTSASTAIVSQKFYDELGRQIAETKKTVVTSISNLLHFRTNFATKKEGTTSSPMKLEGEVHLLNSQDEGYPFSMITYEGNLMKEEWEKEGRPGSNFRIGGKYEKHYSTEPHILINNLFPKDQGYSYRTIRTIMGYEETSVFIGNSNSQLLRAKVAILPEGEQLLATYDYDFHGNMIAATAPQFHRDNRTFMQGKPYSKISRGTATFTTSYKYDGRNRLVEKKTPDGGTSNLVYDNSDNVIYAIHRSNKTPVVIDSILYFDYDYAGNGVLAEVGVLRNFTPTATVSTVLDKPFEKIPRKIIRKLDTQERNVFFQSDLITSYFEDQSLYVEVVGYDVTTTRPLMRAEVIPTKTDYPALLTVSKFNYNAKGNKLLEIELPYEEYSIRYQYSPFGNLLRLQLVDYKRGIKLKVAEYQYNGSNQVVQETLSNVGENAILVTQFAYNSPGFPSKQTNSLIDETMSYEDEGYGGFSLGKINSVMSSTFVRQWKNPYNEFTESYLLKQGLSASFAKICYNALVENSYIEDNRLLKLYQPAIADSMPLICKNGADAQKLLKLFSRSFIQQNSFKFKYQYGSHRDLIKAKFMGTNDAGACTLPLTPVNLAAILKIGADDVTKLWEALKKERFLSIDAQIGIASSSHGKKGLTFLNNENLTNGIKTLKLHKNEYAQELVHYLALHTGNEFTIETICSLIEKWVPSLGHSKAAEDAERVHAYLVAEKYLEDNQPSNLVFSSKFIHTVENVFPGKNYYPEIYKAITSFFNCAIGTSPFDFQVYDQDANGNFKVFYVDGKRLELKYEPGTNKLSKINSTEGGFTKSFEIGHDTFGNLNKALHLNIQKIIYDEVFARPVEFQMSDGTKVKIRYDHKGERVSKDTLSSDGTLLKRKRYLTRDEKERCLLEEELTFFSPDVPPKRITTIFMYGARGLIGFHRNGKFYNVFTDAIGSVRFVLLNGQVVASYDYLPYGHLMGKFVHHEDADVTYRFIGQEWDEEIQLYNFHARIYDPLIGRFYQLDPEEQFFSPYKYGGNSPLNVLDPDGKFIITLIVGITLAVVGAYLGAAAANKSWNPAKWDWKSPRTWLGIGFGALTGALIIPTGGVSITALTGIGLSTAAATATVVGISAGTAYLVTASANKNLNPLEWDWKDPGTLNSIFGGVAMGAGLPAGVGMWKSTFIAFGTTGRALFTVGSVGAFGGFGYLNTAASQGWNPQDWDGFAAFDFILGGAQGAIGASGAVDGVKFFAKQTKLFAPGFTNMAKSVGKAIKYRNFKQIEFLTKTQALALAKATGSLVAVATVTYLGAANAANDWSAFTLKDASTAMALVNGLYSGWMGSVKKPKSGKSKAQSSSNPLRRQGCLAKTTCKIRNTQKILTSDTHETYMIKRIKNEYEKVAQVLLKHLTGEQEKLLAGAKPGTKYSPGATITVMGGDDFVVAAVAGLSKLDENGVPLTKNINVGALLFKELKPGADFTIMDLPYNVFELDGRSFQNMPIIDIAKTDSLIRTKIDLKITAAKNQLRQAFSQGLRNIDTGDIFKRFPQVEKLNRVELKLRLAKHFDAILDTKGKMDFKSILSATVKDMAGENINENQLRTFFQKDKSVKKYINDMEATYKKHSKLLTESWDAANCGESHCLVAIKRAHDLFEFSETTNVGFDQVKYAASYDVKTLQKNKINIDAAKERCSRCLVTTESLPTPSGSIKYIPTDPSWDSQAALRDLKAVSVFPKSTASFTFWERFGYPPEQIFPYFKEGKTANKIFELATQDLSPAGSSSRQKRDLSGQNALVSVTSGGATHKGFLISAVNLVKQFLAQTKSRAVHMEPIQNHEMYKTTRKNFIENENFKSDKSKSRLKNNRNRNCVPHVWLNGEYSFDGFTCSDSLGSVTVFLQENGFENTALAGSYNQDHFSDCQFMEGYFGKKSAFCSGRKSNMIYTPAPVTLPFDRVNDQLMLLLVGINLWQKWTDVQPNKEEVVKRKPSKEVLADLQEQVNLLKGLILDVDNLDPGFTIWANHFLQDRQDDIERFGRNGMTDEDFDGFGEALEDLREELQDIWEIRDGRKEIVEACKTSEESFWERISSYFIISQ